MGDRVEGSRFRGSKMAGKLGVSMVPRVDDSRREKMESGEIKKVRLRANKIESSHV